MNRRKVDRAALFILILGMITARLLPADEPAITIGTQVDTTIATIGDHIHFTVQMSYPVGTTIQLPQLEGQLDKFELINQELSKPERQGELLRQAWRLTLAVFDTGRITIPALELLARKAADTTLVWRFTTPPQTITVYSVLAPDARELKDIKPPFRLPTAIPWRWLLFVLLLIAVGGGSWWYYRDWQRRHPPVVLNEAYLDPPHVIALQRLQALLDKVPSSEEELRLLFFELSEILRGYLERRYFIRALEMATSEIRQVLPELAMAPQAAQQLVELLEDLDYVKYTGTSPAREQLAHCARRAIQLVEATKHESFLRRTM